MEEIGSPMFTDLSQEGRKAIITVPDLPNREQPGRECKRPIATVGDPRLSNPRISEGISGEPVAPAPVFRTVVRHRPDQREATDALAAV